jgi:hypothetical protein
LNHARETANLLRDIRIVCFENAHSGAVGASAAAQDRVSAGALDGGDDGAGCCGAFDEDELVCEAGFYFGDSFDSLAFGTDVSDRRREMYLVFSV